MTCPHFIGKTLWSWWIFSMTECKCGDMRLEVTIFKSVYVIAEITETDKK